MIIYGLYNMTSTLFKNIEKTKIQRIIFYWRTLEVLQVQNLCLVNRVIIIDAQTYHLCTNQHH
jgi:hypothetical protein